MKGKRWVLLVADLHLGSAFAIWPPDFMGSCGSKLRLNVGQKYLLENWRKIEKEVKEITRGKIDILCIVGDVIDGKNRKGEGEYAIEPDFTFQGKAALEILNPFLDISGERYVFRGSRYHVGNNAETEEWIAYSMDAVPDDFGHYCWMWLSDLNIDGVSLDIAHHQSHTIVNRSMPLERERRFSNQVSEITGYPDAIIRAHSHTQVELMVDGELQIGLMPIQLQTAYAKLSRTPNRLLSRWLGVCLLEITPSHIGTVRDPIDVHWLKFKHPPLPKRTYKGDRKWPKNPLSQILR